VFLIKALILQTNHYFIKCQNLFFLKTANIKVYDKETGIEVVIKDLITIKRIDTFLKEQDLSYNISIKGDDCNLSFFILTESPGLTISRFSEIPEGTSINPCETSEAMALTHYDRNNRAFIRWENGKMYMRNCCKGRTEDWPFKLEYFAIDSR